MKAKNVFIGFFVVLALIFGLVLAGCKLDPDDGGNPFVGTWKGYNESIPLTIVCAQSTWTASVPPGYVIIFGDSGTYTYSGNTATFFVDGIVAATGTL